MLSAVFGLFSQDLAIDLGTSTTRIHQRGVGVVCAEPTVVAVHTDRKGRRRVIAIGDDAQPMLGRTPRDVDAIQPLKDARIHDYEVTEAFLHHLIRRLHGRNGWVSPKVVIAIPHSATDTQRRAIRESCETAGAREVHLVPRPLAAALGADLPVDRAAGHMLVDLGAGATEISVLSLSGIVSGHTLTGGGRAIDEGIADHIERAHDLTVGGPTSERVKIALGNAMPPTETRTIPVSGRCRRRGIPRTIQVTAQEIHDAIRPHLDALSQAIRMVLDHVPPEIASDVVDHGVVLTGGGSKLAGLDIALREATGLAFVHAEDVDHAVIHGAGRILERYEVLKAVAC